MKAVPVIVELNLALDHVLRIGSLFLESARSLLEEWRHGSAVNFLAWRLTGSPCSIFRRYPPGFVIVDVGHIIDAHGRRELLASQTDSALVQFLRLAGWQDPEEPKDVLRVTDLYFNETERRARGFEPLFISRGIALVSRLDTS
jgi:hypothetical protein